MLQQTPEEYKEELMNELAGIEAANLVNPSEYKERRISILRDRLQLPQKEN